jgi:Tol biopolymer transport system component
MSRRAAALSVLLGVVALSACNRDEITSVAAIAASRAAGSTTLRDVIVFTAGQPDGQSQLASMNPDGSGRQLITDDPEHVYGYPAISPDGRRIAATRYVLEAGVLRSEGIFLMNADGSGQTLLVNRGLVADGEPAWSPDGSQIAFHTFDEEPFGPVARIYVINVDGTGLRKLSPPTDNPFVLDFSPTWSPDGKRLAFTRDLQLCVINADGTGFTAVPNVDFATGPAWSPDGSRIAYSGASGGIEIRNVDGSNLVALTPNASSPSWSPDGRRLAFVRQIAGLYQLFVINADGTGETRLSFGTHDFDPGWSPFPPSRSDAGASIAIAPTAAKLSLAESRQFSATVRTSNGSLLDQPPVQWSSSNPAIATVSSSGVVTAVDYGTVLIRAAFGGNTASAEVRVVDRVLHNAIVYSTDEFGNPTLAAVRPDGTGRRRLTLDQVPSTSPDVSPDGRRIAFIAGFSIFIQDADAQAISESATPIFNSFNGHLAAPSWSPDGSQIAFRSDVETPFGLVDRIFVINADGSGLRQLSPDDPSSDDAPTWSPDGTRLIFTRNSVLHVINADGTGLTALPNEDLSSSPDWSPDGTRVAYASPAGGIRIRNADGSNLVTVTTGEDSHPRWSPDSRQLVFVRVVAGKSQLFIVNADGTGATQLSTGAGQEVDPSWSPVP